MQARDIMTASVISVGPATSVIEAAALLVGKRISAVPVLSGGALVGIVSEADLMHRYEIGTERPAPAHAWWRTLFGGDETPLNYVEAHAMKVEDIMTRHVVTVGEDASANEVAALFEEHKIKQVPVVSAGSVVGIVSRADFLRALVVRARRVRKPRPTSDAAILRALRAELESQPWWRPDRCQVSVRNGIVNFTGQVDDDDEKVAARVAAQNIPGVRGVEDSRSVWVPMAGYPAGGYL